jgi:allophanate hydrolase subunit 1
VLWDPTREPAALLSPGARVRFVPQGDGPAPAPGGAR